MTAIALRALLGGWLKRVWAFLLAYPLQCALCLSLALNAWLWRGWDHEIAGRKADAARYAAAQVKAKADQDKQDAANFTGQLAHNEKLENNHAPLEQARRDAVSAYIASHSLPAQPKGAACRSGEAGVHSDTGAVAPNPAAPVMVAVSADDLERASQIELQNTERGRFLNGLIEQGLAVAQ